MLFHIARNRRWQTNHQGCATQPKQGLMWGSIQRHWGVNNGGTSPSFLSQIRQQHSHLNPKQVRNSPHQLGFLVWLHQTPYPTTPLVWAWWPSRGDHCYFCCCSTDKNGKRLDWVIFTIACQKSQKYFWDFVRLCETGTSWDVVRLRGMWWDFWVITSSGKR